MMIKKGFHINSRGCTPGEERCHIISRSGVLSESGEVSDKQHRLYLAVWS
jgi:hypothetical protein